MKTKYAVRDAYGFYLNFTSRPNQGGKQPVDGDLFDGREEAEQMVKTHRDGDVVAVEYDDQTVAAENAARSACALHGFGFRHDDCMGCREVVKGNSL